MRRAILALGLTLAAMPLGAPGAEASGGGGCGGPITEGSSATVAIRGSCFDSTITYVGPGTAVTFVNKDRVPHNVLGAHGAWGSFENLRPGKGVTFRFGEAGVYPYVCSWHPGMVGAVVVGAARLGSSDSSAVTVMPSLPPPRTDASVAIGASKAEAGVSAGPWKTVALAAMGLFLLTVVATGEYRRARRFPT